MATIKINVTGEICTIAQKVTFTAGSYGVYVAEVTTDASWDDLALELCVISAPPGYPRIPDSGRCIKRSIPIKDGIAELDETIKPCMVNDNAILIGLLGCDADGKITRYSTVSAAGKVCGSGCIDDTILRDESRWAELISYVNATIKSLIGTPTDEQVRNAIDSYASEHGITTGATADQAAQIEQNTSDIATLSDALGIGTTTDYYFVAGGISSNGTVNNTAINRVRSENYIWTKAGSTISVKSGSSATFNVAAYSGTDTSTLLSYRGMSSEMYTVMQDCYIRFGFSASDTSDPDAVAAATIDMCIITETIPDISAKIDSLKGTKGLPITDAISTEYDFDGDFVNPYVENKINTLYQLWDALATNYPDFVSMETLGQDTSGTYDIRCYTIKSYTDNPQSAVVPRDNLKIVWMGGIHGTENHILYATYLFFKDLLDNHDTKDTLRMLWNNCTFKVIPALNPWGIDNNVAYNSNNVNLNRNFNASWAESSNEHGTSGSGPESEVETQIAVDFIKANTDAFIVVNAHNSSSVTDAGGVGYTASNFYADNLYSGIAGRKIDTALKAKFPFICSEFPDWRKKNLWYNLQSSNKGTMDKWYNYALGVHGFLLELCPCMGTDFGIVKKSAV